MKVQLIYLLLFLFGALATLPAAAQKQVYTGKVTNGQTDSIMPGVSVSIKGTSTGTVTGTDGTFKIEARTGQTILISYVGFTAQEITATRDTHFDVRLQAEQRSLNDVVVVGYGSQKKANLTGAVATVDVAKTFDSKPLNDPTKALQGIVPGLTIQYGNGGLTTGATINIRGLGSLNGTSRPLILVDNVQTDDLSVINPSDIESISVLKDASSASIYGARAAFGVVLIKTKTGKKNQKSTITYTNNFSWNTPTILPDFANPADELKALNDAGVRAGTSSPETFGMNMLKLRDGVINWQKNYAKTNTGKEMILGQDWDMVDGHAYFYKTWDPKKEMLNKYTPSQLHTISFQGGNDKIGYYLSGGYSNDGGIIKMNSDNVKKYNITAGVNAAVTDWLDVRVKTMFRNYNYEYPYQYQTYWYYFWRWGAYFPYGTYQGHYFRVNSAYLDAASKSSLNDNYNRVDLGATVKIAKGLTFNADYTIGRDNPLRHDAGGPVYAWDFWSAATGPMLPLNNIASASQDVVTYTNGRLLVNTFNGYATYQTHYKDHNFKLVAGINAEKDENINFLAARKGLLDPSQGELGLAYGDQTAAPSGSSVPLGWSTNGHGKLAYAGYFGRLNYDYKGKYLLELNGRYDGSSSLSPTNRWAFFPSGSAGWRVTEEKFAQSFKSVVSDLKLRGSYGSIGNQDLGGQYFLPTMTAGQANWMNGSSYAQYIGQPSAVAQSLLWEKVQTLDFGMDARFLKNHVGVTFDWYQRDTKGMLQATSVPSTFGTSGPRINAGNLRTSGYEIAVDANYTVGRDIQLYGTLSFTDYKTKITKYDNPNFNIGQNYVGKTYGEIWGFETDRYFTAADFDASGKPVAGVADQTNLKSGNFNFGAGDVKYKDLNGDGKIDGGKSTLNDHGDLKVIGNTEPRYIYSARLGGSWNNFDLDVFIQGVGKRSWWGTGQTILPLYQSIDILYANQMDYWTPTHTDARYPNPFPGNGTGTVGGISAGGNNFYPQSKYLLNLAYCRLKNVTFGYTLPRKLLSKYNIQKLRFYVSGENLAEISNVGAPIDPEITTGETSGIGRTWPFMRSYSFGLQLTF
ncbi:SusC/RagA family TonB-linked outer membrane protein [Deminuibacter soli]|nr:TonB-dependent receptor [Deminuibacter soli]